tara:strand:+ start:14003 stop:14347 length:345 start_codon:yes stop_codon:yes gene_type:complete
VGPFRSFLLFLGITCFSIFLWFLSPYQSDPYIKTTLKAQGSTENGNRLFRMNCVGCHGISAQGLVGPDLHDVTSRLNDVKIINQVAKGLTPPMPSFEIESQSMADLLAYMHSLN